MVLSLTSASLAQTLTSETQTLVIQKLNMRQNALLTSATAIAVKLENKQTQLRDLQADIARLEAKRQAFELAASQFGEAKAAVKDEQTTLTATEPAPK